MPGEPLDNRSLLKRTLIVVGAMLGGCILLVGTLTLVASSVVGHAVGPAADSSSGASAAHATTVAGKTALPTAKKSK